MINISSNYYSSFNRLIRLLISKKNLTSIVDTQTIKISEKGQIAIPKSIREELGLVKGDTLNIIRDGSIIILEKVDEESYKDLIKHAEKVVDGIWDNEYDEIWDDL